jgi:hypothetical protein
MILVRESSRDRTAHETVPFFNNPEILLEDAKFSSEIVLQILLRMSRSHRM